MRSSIIAAAFAAGALAVPFAAKRDVDVETATAYDVVYTTDVVTVTAGQSSPTKEAVQKHRHHHQNNHQQWTWTQWTSQQQTTTAAPPPPATTSEAPPPASTGSSGGGNGGGKKHHGGGGNGGGSGGGSSGNPATYQGQVMISHNLHRKNHTVADLQWDEGLAASAAKIAASCVYAHNTDVDGGGYGQNIAAGVEGNNVSAIITDLFYNGEIENFANFYGEAQPDMSNFENWGHFTQLVWKATTHVACATQDCSGQGLANVGSDVQPYFTVCNYKSAGNYANEYGDNVLKPVGEPTAQWNTGL